MSFDTPIPPYNASDPHATFLNSSCLDLLLIELVPMAQRLAHEVAARTKDGGVGVGVAVDAETTATSNNSSGGGGAAGGAIKNNEKNDGSKTVVKMLEDDEARDAVFFRLEALGYRVGQGLAERFTRERPRFTDSLDVIKFLCKDLWTLVFRKQVDNLKTNHRGIYVLTDNTFRPLIRMSTEAGGQAVMRAQPFLWFPCGVIRGALVSFGIHATVQAETAELPGATFQIKTAGSRP